MPAYTYSASQMRYRATASGRYVPDAEIRAAVEQVAQRAGEAMAQATEQLRAGQIALAEWRGTMAAQLKLANVATSMVAHGGRAAMAKADWLAVARDIKAEYRYLGTWAAELESGADPQPSRARLYGHNAISQYESMRLRAAQQHGTATEVKNVLGSRESCDGCSAAEALGFVPLDQMSRPGSRDCVSNCRCTLVYRRVVQQRQEAA